MAIAGTLAPLLSYLHEASVAHYVCPEHGELMDAPAGDTQAHASRRRTRESRWADAPGSSPSEHRHCSLVPQRLQPTTTSSVRPHVARLANHTLPSHARPAALRPPVDLLLLAPKTSPPR
jgi:hypothetical protein